MTPITNPQADGTCVNCSNSAMFCIDCFDALMENYKQRIIRVLDEYKGSATSFGKDDRFRHYIKTELCLNKKELPKIEIKHDSIHEGVYYISDKRWNEITEKHFISKNTIMESIIKSRMKSPVLKGTLDEDELVELLNLKIK
jgi:hypothetical protein